MTDLLLKIRRALIIAANENSKSYQHSQNVNLNNTKKEDKND